MQQLLLDKLEVTRTSASRTNVATPASRRSTLAVAGGKSNTNLQTPQVQAGGGHSRVGTANNGSNLLTNKNALREELRGALRAVGADHIDELGMFITKLALDFQLTAGGDPPLSHALLAEEQGVADADALMSGSIATGLKGKDASKMRKASMKPPVLVRKGSTNSMMNNMLTVADKNDARGRRKSSLFITEVDGMHSTLTSTASMSKSESAAASEERAKKEEALRRAALDEKTLFGHVFPGADTVFDQTVAPNGVQVDDILKQVVRMKMKQPNMPSRWATEFQKGKRQHIALSTGIYWYFFLDACPNEHPIDTAVIMDESTPDEVRLEHEKTVAKVREQRARDAKTNKDALFDRMSEFYVSLFGRIVKWTDRDEFLWAYPDFLAQTVFTALCESFPHSLDLFDTDFKTKLSDTVTDWFLGVRPYPMQWRQWPLDRLLSNSTRMSLNGKKSAAVEVVAEVQKSALEELVDGLDKYDRERAKTTKETRVAHIVTGNIDGSGESLETLNYPAESTYPGPGLRAHRVHFDVFRNSPLIGHFLDRAYAGRYQRRSIKIHRAEVERDLRDLLPPPTATNTADDTRQTYRAIVLDSDRRARHNARTFHNHNDTLTRDRVKITVEQAQEARAIERVTGRILARAVDVREISDQICDLHMSGVNEDASVKMKRFAEKSVLEVEKEATRVARRRAATIERRKSLMLK